MTDQWIVIPNWRGFQHYKDRTPKWIKNYVELMSDDAYLGLTGPQRAVLHGIWLEYANARCELRENTASLSRRLNLRVTKRTLNALNHAGFIEFSASKPLAKPEHSASPEVEKSRTPPSPHAPRGNGTNPRRQRTNPRAQPTPTYQCPDCRYEAPTESALRDHINAVHDHPAEPIAVAPDPDDLPF